MGQAWPRPTRRIAAGQRTILASRRRGLSLPEQALDDIHARLRRLARTSPALHTHLDEQETCELLQTRDVWRAVQLVGKGLEKRLWAGGPGWRESAQPPQFSASGLPRLTLRGKPLGTSPGKASYLLPRLL